MKRLATLAFLGLFSYAQAHESPKGWQYPSGCCSDNDCGKITKVVILPNGDMDITIHLVTNMGERDAQAVFPSTFKIEKSGDGDNHACIMGKTPLCLFIGAGI